MLYILAMKRFVLFQVEVVLNVSVTVIINVPFRFKTLRGGVYTCNTMIKKVTMV